MIKIKVVNDEILNGDLLVSSLTKLATGMITSLYLKIEEGVDLNHLVFLNKNIIDYLNDFCDKNKIKKESIKLEHDNLIQNRNIWPNYNKFFNADPILFGQRLNFVYDKDIKKKFGIFVARGTWYRLWLASYLHKFYSDDLLITYHQEFMGDRPNNLRIDELMMELTGSNDKNCLDRVNDFSKHLPFLLEESNDKNNGFINFDQAYNLMPYYKDIFIDIVCETYHKGETFFPTEKIGRCLASKTPFLVYAGKNYLKNLQRLGFHTFSNFFNENYDYYEGRLRLFEMSKIINDLARKKLDELKIIYHNMNKVLEHNYQIYKSLDKKKFLDIFNNV